MNDLTILCPNCQKQIRISEAVTHQVRAHLEQELAARELNLRQQQAELEQRHADLDQQLRARLEIESTRLAAEARQAAEAHLAVEIRDLRNQLNERQQLLATAQTNELQLRQQQRELADRQRALELELTRKLDTERAQIRAQATNQVATEYHLRFAEKEKLISDLQRQLEVLRQKAEQGSIQLQGEVLELALEDELARAFIFDTIEPVAKGQRGGDVIQTVRTNAQLACGAIIWEAKRTKHWGNDWPAKLKADQRAAKAEFAVIVSQALPDGLQGFGQLDGIWVCNSRLVLPLAAALRQGLISTAMAQQSFEGRHTKMEQLYQFLCGTEFRQHIQALVEAFVALRDDLEAEKRAFARHWAKREKQLALALSHTAIMYGGVQGIVGQNALPEIQHLQIEGT